MLERDHYKRFRVSPLDPMTLRCEHVEKILKELAAASKGKLTVKNFAESFRGRPIYLATIGSGPRRVLLWSQMHGDEPTHTAVLLDLVSYLTRFPDDTAAAEVLSKCTLLMLPLLNPDGADLGTRNNAQDIDVNRDALRLATPEGRALERAVEELKPHYGFNLHNQNARTAVGRPPKPAVASVLAPPLDYEDTQTEQIRHAKQIAAIIVEAIRPQADGMCSRYGADYMPRCFGESIQSKGVTTVLIEVGGWPEADPTPLVELHYHGLMAALRAIATESYRELDVRLYDSLPRSSEFALFDCLIRGAQVVDGQQGVAFPADLGINYAHGHRLEIGKKPEGKIGEIGDLRVTRGKVEIDAQELLLIPGRAVFLPELPPGAAPHQDQLNSLLGAGTTTIVGAVNIRDRGALDALAAAPELPVNAGYVAMLSGAAMLPMAEFMDRILFAVTHGVLAVVGDPPDVAIRRYLEWFGIPVLKATELPPQQSTAATFAELARESLEFHKRLGLDGSRGRIRRDTFADFLLFALDRSMRGDEPVDWNTLQRVMVAGESVWENGKPTGTKPGILLRSAAATGVANP